MRGEQQKKHFPRKWIGILFLLIFSCGKDIPPPVIRDNAQPGVLETPSWENLYVERLENGLLVYIYPLSEVPLLSCRLVLLAGSIYEKPSQSGIAALTATLLSQGEFATFGHRANLLGATAKTSVDFEEVVFSLNGLARDWEPFLEILQDLVLPQTFTVENLKRSKEQLFSQQRKNLWSVDRQARDIARRMLFANTPYETPVLGTSRSIQALTLSEIKKFYRSRYVPMQSALILVGDIEPDNIIPKIKSRFLSWKGQKPTRKVLPEFVSSQERRILFVDAPERTNAHILLGFSFDDLHHSDIPSLLAANELFGNMGDSYLVQELWVNQNLSYQVKSTMEFFQDISWFFIETEVSLENVRPTLDTLLKSISNYRAVGPPIQRVPGIRNRLSLEKEQVFESPSLLSDAMAQSFFDDVQMEELGTYTRRLEQVEPSSIRRALLKSFPTGKEGVIVVIGPAETLEPKVRDLGEFTLISEEFFDE